MENNKAANATDTRAYVVSAVVLGGSREPDRFYTGRAGEGFVSMDRAEAFEYRTLEAARLRAENLNRGSQLTGLWFTGHGATEAS